MLSEYTMNTLVVVKSAISTVKTRYFANTSCMFTAWIKAESLTFPCFALLMQFLQSGLDIMWVHTVLCTLLGYDHIAAECCLIPSFLSCSCALKFYSHSYFTLKGTWCGWKWGKEDLDLVMHLFFDHRNTASHLPWTSTDCFCSLAELCQLSAAAGVCTCRAPHNTVTWTVRTSVWVGLCVPVKSIRLALGGL